MANDMARRGGYWVLAQGVLLIAFFLAPLAGAGWAAPHILRAPGWVVAALGLGLLGWSAIRLGASLTPFPRPLPDARLVTDGPYRYVRHPIYSGVLLLCIGISLGTENLLRLAIALVLFVFFDLKSRREEQWLQERYPDYPDYRSRTRRLIPWLY